MMDEIHLIVLWEKARVQERRILNDIARHMTVVAALPQRWPADSRCGFARFYGAKAALARSKVKSCGGGEFMSVIVRDDRPRYGWARTSCGTEFVNLRMLAMKNRYRRWVGGSHCVHTTISTAESARDILLLTGRSPERWLTDRSTDGLSVFAAGSEAVADPGTPVSERFDPEVGNADRIARLCESALPLVRLGSPRQVMRLPDRLYAELVFDGETESGRPCEVSYLTAGREQLEQDWDLGRRFRAVAPQHCRRPYFYRMDGISEAIGIFVRERTDGMSLAEAVCRGMSAAEAERIADELESISDSLERARIRHRNIRPSELLVCADGHVRLRDFRFAQKADAKRETKWLSSNRRALAALGGGYRISAGLWNDRVALARCMEMLPDFPSRSGRIRRLLDRASDVTCRARFRPKYRAAACLQWAGLALNNAWRTLNGRTRKDVDLQRLLSCACWNRPYGDDGWHDLRALFTGLNGSGLRYAVIRNWEMLPDGFDSSLHGDIDLLVEDETAVAEFLKARRSSRLPFRVHYDVAVGGRPVNLDLRHLGDGYYCESWEEDILKRRRPTPSGVSVPSAEDAFHALVYHAVFQKPAIAPDYPGKIAALAAEAGIGGGSVREWTAETVRFLRAHGYAVTRPEDESVRYNESAVAAAMKMV